MSKVLQYIAPVAAIASVALPFLAPATMAALGTAVGAGASSAGIVGSGLTSALLSGVSSAASGNSVGNSLLSAGLGGVGGALAGGAGSSLTNAAGLTGTGAKIASGALTGAAYGGANDGGSGALTGALLGGVGGGVSSALNGTSGASDALTGVTTEVSASGAPMSVPSSSLSSLTTGSGLAAGGGTSALGGTGMNLSDALKLGSSVYSGISTQAANDEMQKQIAAMQSQAANALSPYTTAGGTAANQLSNALTQGFNYDDYANTDAYNFQLSEGQKALQQQLASQGLGQSGAAVKAATEYGTNLANQNYGDAYNQWLQKNSQLQGLAGTGSSAASNLSGILSNSGLYNAMATGSNQNALNSMLSSLTTRTASDTNTNPSIIEALIRGSGMYS